MEPSPPLDGALPSRRPLRLAPPAPTTNLVATSRKVPIATVNSLLSKRILSVESFRRERLERLRLPNKVPPLSKAIPMPLYPGETPQQYNYKFQQWLAKRKESLETLADDPKRERKLWLTFAFFREKPSAREKLPAPRAPKRSINEEYEDFYQRSASQEIKRLRFNANDRSASHAPIVHAEQRSECHSLMPRDQSRNEVMDYEARSRSRSTSRPSSTEGKHSEGLSSYQLPASQQRSSSPSPHSYREEADTRSRREILASYVISADAFVREIKRPKKPKERTNGQLNKIPMPLFPGETVNDYDREFGRWLHQRQTSLISLQNLPLKERVYRHQFARQRVMTRLNRQHSRVHESSQFPEREASDAVQEGHKICDSTRDEGDSITRKASTPTSRKALPNDFRKNEASIQGASSQITMSKNAETKNEDARQKDLRASSIRGAERINKQEAKVPQAISSEANIAAERSSSKSLCNSDKLPHSKKKKPVEPSQEKPPSWALLLINRVEELEAKVTRLQHQVDACPHCQGGPTAANIACNKEPPVEASTSAQQALPPSFLSKTIATSERIGDDINEINKLSEMVDVEIKSKPGKMKNEAAPQPTYEEIHREATRNLARAVQSRTHEDSKQQKLAEAYDHLNEQISMNETAIDDALDYIKAIKDIDEAKANEQHSQIMELVVSINTEKERRASALAALIVHNFAERQNMLKTLLEETPSARTTNGVSHGKLGTISSQIEERESVLETLKVHLNEQLDWVTGIPPCVSEPDKALRFKALRKMSKKVAKEQEAKERLLQEREEILKEFVQQDNEIRKLVKESLQKVS
ncbi:hypothetical protein DVH05_023047 [Phytophthora capsici]|nr:hypothetical protein DVH05_023047 [Phytophthora capsici]